MDLATNIENIRKRFPSLNQQVNKHPLVYFDNAASSQTVDTSIKAIHDFYLKDKANIHRGVHMLAERATTAFEATRKAVQTFVNARETEEIIFTKGTTESINLVAHSWARKQLKKGDEIIISQLEHHSNIVPWQLITDDLGIIIKVIPINEKGELSLDAYYKLINEKTKLVAVNYISNALGTINPVKEITKIAKENGALMLIDAAQATHYLPIDVQDLECDFLAFSGHKMYGPTGVGVLYGRREVLEKMSPYQGGGEMIKEVSFEKTTFNDIPYKFEAGTPSIGDVIALKYAIEFILEIGYETIQNHEKQLVKHATKILSEIPQFKPIGTAHSKTAIISFLLDGFHYYDVGQLLDAKGIAVRTGHHCTQPLMNELGIEGTIRASFAVYNTIEEVDIFCETLKRIVKKFS